MGDFADQIKQFSDKAKGNALLVVKKVGIDALSSVVDRSPVGNPDLWKNNPPPGYVGGRFRGNWQVSFEEPSGGTVDSIDADGSQTKSAGVTFIASFDENNKVIWLVNNLPYAQPLEYGWSTQAPQGMVRLTVAEFNTSVEQAVAGLPK